MRDWCCTIIPTLFVYMYTTAIPTSLRNHFYTYLWIKILYSQSPAVSLLIICYIYCTGARLWFMYMSCADMKQGYDGCLDVYCCEECCSKRCHCVDLEEEKCECVSGAGWSHCGLLVSRSTAHNVTVWTNAVWPIKLCTFIKLIHSFAVFGGKASWRSMAGVRYTEHHVATITTQCSGHH